MRCNDDENSALSATLKYCLSLNFFSRASNCWVVKGVLGFRFGLCFLRLHLILGGSPFSERKKRNTLSVEVHVAHENSVEHYARTNKLTDRYLAKVFRGIRQRRKGPRDRNVPFLSASNRRNSPARVNASF